jgi:hypothetical protein
MSSEMGGVCEVGVGSLPDWWPPCFERIDWESALTGLGWRIDSYPVLRPHVDFERACLARGHSLNSGVISLTQFSLSSPCLCRGNDCHALIKRQYGPFPSGGCVVCVDHSGRRGGVTGLDLLALCPLDAGFWHPLSLQIPHYADVA